MDLFDQLGEKNKNKVKPLAARMRPRTLDDFVGQEQIVGEGKILRRSIEADRLTPMIFYGPPGTGKTTLAEIIANTTKSNFMEISAVIAGVKDIREILKKASDNIKLYNKRTVLFIDEIHRFNKAQQDALLPAVEDGTIILIGATTENPYFEVNAALLSRSKIFRLEPLNQEAIIKILNNAVKDNERGLGTMQVKINPDALEHWATMCGGDARIALNALEIAVLTTKPNKDGIRVIDLKVAEESIQKRAIKYDKSGDYHYDIISAFIKSMRGSDPDAAMHWLARMIEAGESPEFIMRRVLIHAAEDVGMADPQALVVANAAASAVQHVGWPEARIIIAEAVIYIATAPKSNAAYLAIDQALQDVKSKNYSGVPAHLRDTSYQGAKNFKHGEGYLYPHSYENAWVKQNYLPPELKDSVYYMPNDNGYEAKLKKYWQSIKNKE